jgi:hypothetical protein
MIGLLNREAISGLPARDTDLDAAPEGDGRPSCWGYVVACSGSESGTPSVSRCPGAEDSSAVKELDTLATPVSRRIAERNISGMWFAPAGGGRNQAPGWWFILCAALSPDSPPG